MKFNSETAEYFKLTKKLLHTLCFYMLFFYIKEILCVSYKRTFHRHVLLDKTPNGNMFSITICRHCFINHRDLTVLIDNINNVDYIRKFKHNLKVDVVSLLGAKTESLTYYREKQKFYKLDSFSENFFAFPAVKFVIPIVDLTLLKLAIYKVRNSIWWNIHGKYFIENTTSNGSCVVAQKVLKTVWEFDISQAIFVCFENDGNLTAYTFNPYTSYASKIWVLKGIYRQNNGHSFAVFKLRDRLNDSSIKCHDLFFEKTKTIRGYPIKIIGSNIKQLTPLDPMIKSEYVLRGTAGEIIEIVLTKLNASLELTISNLTKQINKIDEKGIPHGKFKEVFDGKYDMMLEYKFSRDIWQNQISTNIQSGFCYISSKDKLTLKSQVLSMISGTFFIYIAILFITSIAFAFLSKINFFDIILNELRAFIGHTVNYQPRSTTTRIFFILFIFIAISTNYLLQTHLHSLLVSNIPFSPVESRDDLVNYRYIVYGYGGFHNFFSHTLLKDRMYHLENTNDFRAIMNNRTKVAYVDECYVMRYYFFEDNDIHITNDENFKLYFVIVTRNYFSLKDRIAQLYRSLFEGGIIDFRLKLQYKMYKSETKDIADATSFSIDNLEFILNFLKYGLCSSIVIFLMEIIVCFFKNFISTLGRTVTYFIDSFIRCFRKK